LLSIPFGNLLIFSTIAFAILFNLPVMITTLRKLLMEASIHEILAVLYLVSWFKKNSEIVIQIAMFYLLGIIFNLIFLISKFLSFALFSYILVLIPTLFVTIIVAGCTKGTYEIMRMAERVGKPPRKNKSK
jgi:hypothetical protein